MSVFSILLLFMLVLGSNSRIINSIIPRDSNTKLVIIGTRHGNRNPAHFFRQIPQTWGFEGANELTIVNNLTIFQKLI